MSSYVHKVVRDLEWVFKSNQMLEHNDGVHQSVPDGWMKNIALKSKPWLDSLDENPTPLFDWINGKPFSF